MGCLYAGASGWAYPEWRGAFYPAKARAGDMLAIYARHFSTVEVNNTFYRMPRPEAILGWRDAVPADFRFTFKAPASVTHRKDLGADPFLLDRFAELLKPLGELLGPVLFQLDTVADIPRLDRFLTLAGPRFHRAVVEFRHASWFQQAAYDVLRTHDVALCQTETDEGRDPSLPAGGFCYLRLRKSAYGAAEMGGWLERLRGLAAAGDVFCYVKHDLDNVVLLRDLLAWA